MVNSIGYVNERNETPRQLEASAATGALCHGVADPIEHRHLITISRETAERCLQALELHTLLKWPHDKRREFINELREAIAHDRPELSSLHDQC